MHGHHVTYGSALVLATKHVLLEDSSVCILVVTSTKAQIDRIHGLFVQFRPFRRKVKRMSGVSFCSIKLTVVRSEEQQQ